MKIVFLVDPIESFKIEKDTSYALMLATGEKGHEVWVIYKDSFYLKEGSLFFINAQRVAVSDKKEKPFTILESKRLAATEIDALLIRTDPPFDELYLMHTWFLDHMPENVFVMNSPHGLRTVNEKIWAAKLTHITPKTVITSRKKIFKSFLEKNKIIAVKPADGFGGSAIFIVHENDKNANVIFESVSENGRKYAILQQYLPEAEKGDKRVLILDGEILGAILRLHSKDDHRNNFAAGGKALRTEVTLAEKKIIDEIKPYLQELGLYFVGLDFIGEKLMEVNVTSPTCLREMNAAYKKRLDFNVIEFIEKKCASMRH